ncbi:MAG: hypothetical protein ACOX52_13780 [Verrucomicrobiota bacterium]
MRWAFSKFISFGNKADVGEIELLSYLAKDPATSVIAMYLEGHLRRRPVHPKRSARSSGN